MALKKSELYSSLWQSCDELRGGMDASQYKDYVLVLLFIKYVSDKYSGQHYAPITIPTGASFKDMVALKGKSDIGDQINKKIIVARYFAKEQTALDQLAADLDGVSARLVEMEEEHGGEDGAFAELDKVNKASVVARMKEIADDDDAKDEFAVLTDWLKLAADEADLKRRVKESETALDARAYARYPKLTEEEIKTLVVDDKWLAALDATIHGDMDRVSRQLTQRVRELAERYETPLPQLISRATELEARVNRHLATMGFAWK